MPAKRNSGSTSSSGSDDQRMKKAREFSAAQNWRYAVAVELGVTLASPTAFSFSATRAEGVRGPDALAHSARSSGQSVPMPTSPAALPGERSMLPACTEETLWSAIHRRPGHMCGGGGGTMNSVSRPTCPPKRSKRGHNRSKQHKRALCAWFGAAERRAWDTRAADCAANDAARLQRLPLVWRPVLSTGGRDGFSTPLTGGAGGGSAG